MDKVSLANHPENKLTMRWKSVCDIAECNELILPATLATFYIFDTIVRKSKYT